MTEIYWRNVPSCVELGRVRDASESEALGGVTDFKFHVCSHLNDRGTTLYLFHQLYTLAKNKDREFAFVLWRS